MTGLFDAPKPKRARWRGSTALVLLDQTLCIRCRGPLEIVACDQLPLFRHAGYGEAMREVHHNCPRCATSRKVLSTAISPLRVFA